MCVWVPPRGASKSQGPVPQLQVFEMCKAAEWTASEELLDQVNQIFTTVGQSCIIELGVHASRRAEDRSWNKSASVERRWSTLFNSSVINGFFRYEHIPGWQDELMDRGMLNHRIMPQMFEPRPSRASCNMKTVMSSRRTPLWHSPKPAHDISNVGDLDMLDEVARNNTWLSATKAWLGMLATSGGLLLQSTSKHRADEWFLCVGTPGIQGKRGIKVTKHRFENIDYFSLQAIAVAGIQWFHIYQLDDWRAWKVSWCSPAQLSLRSGIRRGIPATLIALPDGRPDSLLRVSARHAFWELPKTALGQLATYVGCEVDLKQGLHAVLLRLINHALPELDEEAVCGIIEARLSQKFDAAAMEFLKGEGFELLTKEDQKTLKEEMDEEGEETAASRSKAEFVQAVKAARKRHAEIAARKGGAKPKRGAGRPQGQAQGANASGRMPVNGPAWSDHTLTAEAVQGSLPPKCRVWRDTFCKRWMVSFADRSTKSCSWALHGYSEGAAKLIAHAWWVHEHTFAGAPCPFPEVRPARLP